MRKTVVVLIGLFLCAMAFAQGHSIRLRLEDSSNGEPVGFATVHITKEGSKTALKYTLSDAEGNVHLEKIRAGKYTIASELMGYKNWQTEIELKGDLDLGTVKVDPDEQFIDAATVSATGNPIIVKKDTVEYNASSFLQTDNDMLEDLLKKLPGVEVSESGTVTFNGEEIKKITIEGKTFFLDDPQLATKNLPSKIVDKLKVIQKKSEQAEFTGIDDGEEEMVIDLTVKKGMLKGWFGNLMAGGGHDIPGKQTSSFGSDNGDWRYQGAGFIGNFTESRQLSIILNGNNTNNRGFNDISGSMMGNMRGGGGGMGRGQGGWGNSNGITTSYMAGANGAWTLFGGNMDLGGNYVFNGTEKEVLERSSKTTYLEDRNLIYDNGIPSKEGERMGGYNLTNSYGHRFGVRLEHKFSENTSIIFQPSVNFGNGNYSQFSRFKTSVDLLDDSPVQTLNDGFTNSTGKNKNLSTDGFFLFRQRLGIPGRTISFMGRYSFSWNQLLDGVNQSLTNDYTNGEISGVERVNQGFKSKSNSTSVFGRIVYTEPLGAGFYAEANYRFSYNRNYSNKETKDYPVLKDKEDGFIAESEGIPNPTYSNEITNESINHTAGLNLMFQKEKIRAQLGVAANPTYTYNRTIRANVDTTYTSKVLNWAPQAMLWYEINDNTNLRFFYHGRSAQPSTSQLMPVPDNTDPLNVSFGNPYLKPYFNHNMRGEFRFTNKKSFSTFNVFFNGSFVQSPIVNATWYGVDGVSYNMPVNGPVSVNANIRTFLNTPIAKSNFSIYNMLNLGYSASSSYVGSNIQTDKF